MSDKNKENKCNWSDEGFHALVCAIIDSAESDWNIAARSINKKGYNTKDLYQLKQIIDFINSDWFRDLTNHTCSQSKALDLLMDRIKEEKTKKELNQFITINRKKWEKSNKYHQVKTIK